MNLFTVVSLDAVDDLLLTDFVDDEVVHGNVELLIRPF
jgi:hypothetical protein